MQCIFCSEERSPSVEHVFPLAIGGTITTDRVCLKCNSELGTRVDAALSDFFPVRMRRAKLALAGNEGTPPAWYEMFLGQASVIHAANADGETSSMNLLGGLKIWARSDRRHRNPNRDFDGLFLVDERGEISHRKRPPPCGQSGGGASMRSRNASGDISQVRPHRMEGSWPERHQIITVSCDTPSNSAASATRNPRRAVFSINKL